MSNIVTKTKIVDGPKSAVVHIYLESDGQEGELDNYVLLDPVADFGLSTDHQLTVTQVWYSLVWFDVLMKFSALSNYPSWMLPRVSDSNYLDFRYFGGLKDRATAEHTGQLLISTTGFAPQGSIGTLVVEVKKNLRNQPNT